MPKATSKTFKKKKYNARFPPARIKKIMQTDEEVGKVAAAVPVIISRALEMFIESLILQAAKTTQAKNAKTLSSSHIKQTINAEKQFDFLRDVVKNVPDHQTEENNGDIPLENEPVVKKGRGRPKKIFESSKPVGRRSKSGNTRAPSDTSDEEEEEEYNYEDDEDTETDEEVSKTTVSAASTSHDRLQPLDHADSSVNLNHQSFSGAGPAFIFHPQGNNIPMHYPPYYPPYQSASLSLPSINQPSPTVHFMPHMQHAPQQQLPINLSNPPHQEVVGVKLEDDNYDS